MTLKNRNSNIFTLHIVFLDDTQWRELNSLVLLSEHIAEHIVPSLSGSFVHGILQARILEWVAISFSRGSSQPRDWTQVSWIAGRFFTIWATWEAEEYWRESSQSRDRTPVSYISYTGRWVLYHSPPGKPLKPLRPLPKPFSRVQNLPLA